jgi:hypothetical protein
MPDDWGPRELRLLVAVGRTLLALIRGAGQLPNLEDLYGLREALIPFEPPVQPLPMQND